MLGRVLKLASWWRMPTKTKVRSRLEPICNFDNLQFVGSARVPHDLAHQCLLSMPFESDRAISFLNQVRKILEFQSTIDILKGMYAQRRVCFYPG